ncbi:hypothetical protein SEA_MADAMATO_32 [Streptomyces phage Madamato]|nr:hypothetical protein SEA_MADAMATO_32 [Streptomyces phage Madamato]
MKNEKLSKIKSKIKKHAPEIALAAIAVATTAYSIILKQKLEEESKKLPEGGVARLALNDCCFEELKSGDNVIWKIDGYTIDLAYDPDC